MTAEALKSLLTSERAAIERFLIARGSSAVEAEDLLQDLFIKLETRPTGPVADVKAYLYRMADNLFLDCRRAEQRRKRREEDWSAPEGTLSTVGSPASLGADQALIAQEQLRAVESALAQLPERTTEVFSRFRIDGQRQSAIAADLGISLSAVEKHLG